jgi:hypothetical protein
MPRGSGLIDMFDRAVGDETGRDRNQTTARRIGVAPLRSLLTPVRRRRLSPLTPLAEGSSSSARWPTIASPRAFMSSGEIPEQEPGKSASHTFMLKPGAYVYICNVPGHYAAGMRGTLTVKY